MSIEIRASGDQAEQDLRSLYEWLRDEPDVHRHARIALGTGKAEGGDMGTGPLEVIQLVIDSTFQLANLALAVVAWRATRRPLRGRQPEVTISRDGTQVTLTGADPENVARILRALDAGNGADAGDGGR